MSDEQQQNKNKTIYIYIYIYSYMLRLHSISLLSLYETSALAFGSSQLSLAAQSVVTVLTSCFENNGKQLGWQESSDNYKDIWTNEIDMVAKHGSEISEDP